MTVLRSKAAKPIRLPKGKTVIGSSLDEDLWLAWPMLDGGDLEVTFSTPIRIVTDPITGNHGQGHSNAGSHNSSIKVVQGASKYGRTVSVTSLAIATRQVVTRDMVGFPTKAITIVLHYHKLDGTARNSAAIGVVPDGTSYNGVCNLDIPASDGKLYFDFGGVTSPTTRLGGISGLTYGDDVWIATVGPRGMEVWQNGVKVASQSATPTRTNSDTAQFGLWGADPATYAGGDLAESGLLLVYGHQLSESEIARLSFDPWTPFRRKASVVNIKAPLAPITGDGAGVLSLSGSATAAVAVAGAGAGTLVLSGSAEATIPVTGDGAGVLAFTGAAEATVPVTGAGVGILGLQGSAVATDPIAGAGAGTLLLSGSGMAEDLVGPAPTPWTFSSGKKKKK